MINIVRYKLREQFRSVLYYLIGLIAYAWLLIAMFPTMEKIDLSAYPEEFLKFFGGDSVASLSTIEGFLSLEFLSLFFVLIISFYVASSAAATIAGAIEKKTIDFQLSQPISRTKLVLSESIVTMFYTFFLVNITSFSIFLLSKLYGTEISNRGLLTFSLTATFFMWSIYGISIFISSLLKNKITVAALSVSLVMTFYILTAMSKIVDKLSSLEKLSIFYVYDPQKLLGAGHINTGHVEILTLILLLGLAGSLYIFNKKNL